MKRVCRRVSLIQSICREIKDTETNVDGGIVLPG